MDVGNNPRRIYAIVRLAKAAEGFEVKTVRAVPYQSVGVAPYMYPPSWLNEVVLQISTSGAPMHPRLQRILNGEVFAIQFGDAVTICAIGMAHTYFEYDAKLISSCRRGIYG